MFKRACIKWTPIAVMALGVNFTSAETWSSLDATKTQSVSSTSNASNGRGLSPAASQMLFSDIEMLKQEIQTLRSTIEEQGYELNKLKTEQKERYLDLDRRMSQLVKQGGQNPTSEPPRSGDGQVAYDEAFGLMKSRKLPEAAVAFKKFLQSYPNSSLVVNGYYWLGQIYYNQGDLDEARKAFTIVVNQYPEHQKSADSAYKLGVVLHRLGDTAQSKTFLQQVVKQYPDSASARFASKYLKDNFK
ncbi:cell division protein CpoB [Oceaniserpentilla sp. 4NH20-0058]|uniref:tol-pal system protein YbgF n=1 Tax=Oceaniserpentilla sp. 4NH20-0058 TaxID=3127660 RepID=UPI0031027F73